MKDECSTTPCDWSRNIASFSQPIDCKTNTNRDLVTYVIPPFSFHLEL